MNFLLLSPLDIDSAIAPIACHSHNDYLREVPLYDALAAGCTGVEADVWLKEDDLLVAHTEDAISDDRTLQSLYLDPLLLILQERNPDDTTTSGVFEAAPDRTMTLLIDFKTDDPLVYDHVLSQLDPLRSHGWLTFWDGSATNLRPITVVATGEALFDHLTANDTYRDVFFDAPLDKLEDEDTNEDATKYSTANSYYASVSFKEAIGSASFSGQLSSDQIQTIRAQISAAEDRGLKSRYWDTPDSPSWIRTGVWNILEEEGVGTLSVDDVEEARSMIM